MIKYINEETLRKLMYEEAFEKDSDMQKWDSGCWIRYKLFENCLEAVPAADVAPVQHGRWIVKGDAQPMSNDKVYGCSLCDDKNRRYYKWQLSDFSYCSNCGAKMDGGQDE